VEDAARNLVTQNNPKRQGENFVTLRHEE